VTSVFDLVGEDGFARLISAFYARVPDDPILSPMYPADDLAGAEARLRDFLVYRFGGPQGYIEERGHPRLRQRHAPFPVDVQARDRWLALMNLALEETELHPAATEALLEFFRETSAFLVNRADIRPGSS